MISCGRWHKLFACNISTTGPTILGFQFKSTCNIPGSIPAKFQKNRMISLILKHKEMSRKFQNMGFFVRQMAISQKLGRQFWVFDLNRLVTSLGAFQQSFRKTV